MLRLLFGSEARVRVLALLLTGPEGEYYLRDISRRTGCAPHAVRQEMARLGVLGLAHAERRGNRTYYRANEASPIFPELKTLFLKTAGLGDLVRQTLEQIGGVEVAILYGSLAAQRETLESDVDLLLVGDAALSTISPSLRKLEAQVGREVNVTILSVDELRQRVARSEPFVSEILSHPMLFLVGTEEQLRGLVA